MKQYLFILLKFNIYKVIVFVNVGFKITKFSIKFIKSFIKAKRIKSRKLNTNLITIYEDL